MSWRAGTCCTARCFRHECHHQLWDGLLSFDCYGKAVPSVAKEWSHNEDSSVWTFNLRDDVDWVDVNGEVKAHLTSKDFLVGLEWVLNAAKNQANNTSMPNETLTGAADYYQKTSDMGDAAADLTYQDMLDAGVGVEAPDDYTLVFTCKDPCPYFDTVAAYTSFYPVSEDLINELGIEGFRACDYTNMWYNGPYVVEEFISQNTKSYIPNPNYFGANDVSRFDRFTVTMISDGTVTFQLYQNRELDEMDVGESTLTTIQADPNSEYNAQLCEKRPKKYSYQMHFNYQKNNEDGTPDDNWNKAIANKAFRQCFYKGLELTNWYARTNKINPLKCENDYYTMPGVCYNTQGQEYTTLVAKEMGFDKEAYDGKTMIRLRANNGDIADLKKQAMDELSAIGVTFPVHAAYYIIAGNSTALDNATVLKQCFTDSFGDDFIVLDIKTYVSSITRKSAILSCRASSSTAGALTSAIPSTSLVRRSCTTTTLTTAGTTPTSPRSWRPAPLTGRRIWWPATRSSPIWSTPQRPSLMIPMPATLPLQRLRLAC